ncbi:MAG TPA: hypothetical protein VFN74_02120, partial [Chloroflexota bacterium]|nr:hypothetical protein [Chloroflexota bacterium]
PLLRDAMLAGYRSVRPLPEPHALHLPAFIAARRLIVLDRMGSNVDTPSFRSWVHDAIAQNLRGLTAFAR